MNKSEQYKLHRLLSKGSELSVQEKEKMLTDLLGPIERSLEKRSSVRMLVWVGSVSAAAAVALFTLFIGLSDDTRIKGGEKEFTVRGSASAGSFRIECIEEGGKKGACTYGNKIVFGVLPPKNASSFSVAAVDENGKMIRYFPSETDTSLYVTKPGIQNTGIKIGQEHRPGKYRVFGVFSAAGISIVQMKQIIEAYALGKKSGVKGVVLVKEYDMEVVSQ